jgi:hypothetical protein
MMEISGRGFKMIKKREILMPHPLKRYLGVGCVTKWYQSRETTLGLLGLTKESSDYFFFLENFKGEGTLPYPI